MDFLDQPRLTNFGLAKRLEGDSELTLSGQTLGTPNYMPPEQAVSKRGKVGRASEVYGLGAIFYHLLTGRPPHAGETAAETIQQTLNAEPVRPRLLNPSVPADAETICLKCLEEDSAKRYPTASALAEDVGRFLEGEPILARPLGAVGKAWRRCRRKPQLAGAMAALVLVLTLGVAGIAWQGHKATREAARATQEAKRANTNSAEAELNLYAADMLLAQQAFLSGNFGRGVELVRRYGPGGALGSGEGPELRGWEWRYLDRVTRENTNRILGRQERNVSVVAVLSDGNLSGLRCATTRRPIGSPVPRFRRTAGFSPTGPSWGRWVSGIAKRTDRFPLWLFPTAGTGPRMATS